MGKQKEPESKYLAARTIFVFCSILAVIVALQEGNWSWPRFLEHQAMIFGGLGLFQGMLYLAFRQEIKQENRQEKLRESGKGLKVIAEILSVKQTGKYINEMPVFNLELKYSVNGQEIVKPEYRVLVAFTEFDIYKPGKYLELLVDPEDFQNVVLVDQDNVKNVVLA